MIIGITGGVGCGKSTVLEILKKDYGAKVLIADNMGHEVMKKGGKPIRKSLLPLEQRLLGMMEN